VRKCARDRRVLRGKAVFGTKRSRILVRKEKQEGIRKPRNILAIEKGWPGQAHSVAANCSTTAGDGAARHVQNPRCLLGKNSRTRIGWTTKLETNCESRLAESLSGVLRYGHVVETIRIDSGQVFKDGRLRLTRRNCRWNCHDGKPVSFVIVKGHKRLGCE